MKLFCNFRKRIGCDKQRKISVVDWLTICFKNFLSWFAASRMKKLNASTRTGIYRGGASAFLSGCSTATANKSFTGSSGSHLTACPNTLMTFQTSITKTNTNGNCWHSNMMNNFTGVWQRSITGQIGMFASFGKCTARTEA